MVRLRRPEIHKISMKKIKPGIIAGLFRLWKCSVQFLATRKIHSLKNDQLRERFLIEISVQ